MAQQNTFTQTSLWFILDGCVSRLTSLLGKPLPSTLNALATTTCGISLPKTHPGRSLSLIDGTIFFSITQKTGSPPKP
jgi:hypothetical protein